MTNQETIANLNMISVAFVEPVTKEQRKLIDDTFDMAIKALEIEPCEDAISRQKALLSLTGEDLPKDRDKYIALVNERIKALRPVTTEPKTGHWQLVSYGYGDSAYICECSECKDTIWVYKDADRKWKYCPNCGTKMVEPQESGINNEKEI